MNRRILHYLAFAGLAYFLFSCNNDDREGAPARQQTLNSAPYKVYTDSIREFPDQPSLYVTRAAMLSHNNLHELATADYKKTWELTNDPGVALDYASNLLLTNKVPEAIALLEQCADKFPDNTEFSRRLGEIHVELGQPKRALQQYDELLQRDSANFETWFDKGTLLARMKDTAGAIAALEKSFSLMPISYSGLALAQLYADQKDERALEVCDILLARDSGETQAEPFFLKGVYYSETKQPQKALEQFEACIRRDWKMTDAYIEKGIIQYEQKQYDEALKTFNMAATVSNTDADAYFWMGRCFEASGDQAQAIENYRRAIALDGGLTEAREALRRLNG